MIGLSGHLELPILKGEKLSIYYLENILEINLNSDFNFLEVIIDLQKINTIEFENTLFISEGKFLHNEQLGKFKLQGDLNP